MTLPASVDRTRPTSTAVRVALIDEHELVHRGLAAMLKTGPYGIELIDPATAPSRRVDLALLDPAAPGSSRRTARLLADPNVARVVAYTWNFQPWLARGLLDQGLSGYIAKSVLASDLARALHAVHVGRVVVLPPAKDSGRGRGWVGADAGLTPREAEVLALITAGLSNQSICERLVVSPNSVKSYIRSCYRKIGVESRTQAVLWGLTAGLTTGAPHPVESSHRS